MKTLSDLEEAIRDNGLNDVTVHFGHSRSPNHKGYWFANGHLSNGRKLEQVRAEDLPSTLAGLFEQAPAVEPERSDDLFGDL